MDSTHSFRTESAPSFRFNIQGIFDNATATALANELSQIAARSWGDRGETTGQETLVVDLTKVDFINSTGIGALLRCKQIAEANGRGMLVIIHRGLADIFEIAKLYAVFDLVIPYDPISGHEIETNG
ncbi:MAG TPA: STAS domain-containing protein [bacterium]|nr:STAS domain-containing protein [bacterium]HPO09599.1 STAS domain-containing protein [bacterium]HQP99900.1 STAS domain-containing protein [bacterium]